jgi:tRNA1Val (adenine37-N6)-methyltransferase
MPNDYFQFQQFRIEQADCAQKVSTDACILGAAADLTAATRVLDIGTGTGLLALMAAQRAPAATIEAVELDPATAAQAAANVAASPWATRIAVHPLSLAAYAASLATVPTTAESLFSHIICNPPFFRRSLAPPAAARALARHAGEESLTFAEICAFAAAHLQPSGTLTVLLPPPEMQHFAEAAGASGLAVQARLAVQHRPGGRITRSIWQFGPEAPASPRDSSLVIQDADGHYSAAFQALLAGFYLAL